MLAVLPIVGLADRNPSAITSLGFEPPAFSAKDSVALPAFSGSLEQESLG